MSKSLKSFWEQLLFRDRGILPSRRLLILYLAFSMAIVLLNTTSDMSWGWLFTVNGGFFLVSLTDLLLSPKKGALTFKRRMPDEMERGTVNTVQIEVVNDSDYTADVWLKDGLPQTFDVLFPLKGSVGKRTHTVLAYNMMTPVRGNYHVRKLFVRYRSVFGLWEKQMAVDISDDVKVIPDLTETRQYLESPQQFLLYQGTKIRKQRAETGEFSQIRHYAVGDDPRKINWRQTAKLQEIMTNEYEPEHGKYVTILIDCGRMMGAELKNGNRLEKALEAALTTAAAALKNGDYVAVLAFSKDVNVFIPPEKGMNQLQKILQGIYNLRVEAHESNYPAAIHYLSTALKKRSLILLFSDVHTFLHEESALHQLKGLRKRHLFIMIGIEDEALLMKTRQAPDNAKKAMVKSIAQQQIQIKKREKVKWEKQGLLMVEAQEEHLATAAVSQYGRIMNEGLL